ncbi:MAG: malto-oligosyltrehalose trehalohydrolase [Acidobacteriaceae bacterium]
MAARKLPVGAEVSSISSGGAHFRVWAPKRKRVEIVRVDADGPLHQQKVQAGSPLQSEGNGYFSGDVAEMRPGSRYAYALDGEAMYPDPASRFQPFGPHGASEIIAPEAFRWNDNDALWRGVSLRGQVIYELHIGTFTPEGTYQSAIAKLQHLKELGVSVIEVMPVADFPGNFGWGYDGVNLFAPTRLYGRPDDFRAFVQAAHDIGLAVILDVVYNHLGPSGNYLGQFSDDYLTDKHCTDWGSAINFDGENSRPVRELYVANAAYWIREFHLDGLRLDATQAIFDDSATHILKEIQEAVRSAAAGRETIIVAENEDQNASLISEYGVDAVWNDDLHHSEMVALTGNRQAYYHDHLGHAQEFISAVKYGYLFQGQQYRWQRKRRGKSVLGTFPDRFVVYLENHDQVANSGRGERLSEITSPARLRAMTAFTLLAPGTPMLFQGQEWASSNPFLYFADHDKDLAELVRNGRQDFLKQFPALATSAMRRCLSDPESPETFARCKLEWSEIEQTKHRRWLRFHHDLLQMRRTDPAFVMQGYGKVDGAVLTHHAFVLRYFLPDGRDRLLVVNFGPDLILFHVPEPLLAPILGCRWKLGWSTEDPRYGGCGMTHPDTENEFNWSIRAESLAVLLPEDCESAEDLDERLWRIEPSENENDREE